MGGYSGHWADRVKIFKNAKLSCQIFTRQMTMQITRYPKGNPKKYTKVRNSNFFLRRRNKYKNRYKNFP